MPSRRLGAAAVLLALAAVPARPGLALASAWSENPESAVRLITPYRVAPRDGEIWLGLHFRLAPEWHVYWKNSGDAGFPPEIDLAATPELGEAELLWPAPERYELPGDLVAFGYEDEVVYPIRARIAAGGAERVEIALTVDYLVCQVDCVPYRYTLTVGQPVGGEPAADPETAELLAAWRDRLPRPAGEVPGLETDGRLDLRDLRRPVLEVTVAGARPAPGLRPELFLEVHELFDPEEPALEESPGGLRFRVPLGVKRALESAPRSSAFAWTVTGLAGEEGGGPLAIEARRQVAASLEPASAALPPTGDGPGRRPWMTGTVTALALAFLVLALWLWGLLGDRGRRPRERRLEALGFAALAPAVGLLYLLSRQVESEVLAFIELSFLALGLAAWARSRAVRPAARALWAVLAAAAGAAALWLVVVG